MWIALNSYIISISGSCFLLITVNTAIVNFLLDWKTSKQTNKRNKITIFWWYQVIVRINIVRDLTYQKTFSNKRNSTRKKFQKCWSCCSDLRAVERPAWARCWPAGWTTSGSTWMTTSSSRSGGVASRRSSANSGIGFSSRRKVKFQLTIF